MEGDHLEAYRREAFHREAFRLGAFPNEEVNRREAYHQGAYLDEEQDFLEAAASSLWDGLVVGPGLVGLVSEVEVSSRKQKSYYL